MFFVFGSEFRSSMVFSFIFSVRPISRRNIAIKIISSIQSGGIKRLSGVGEGKERAIELGDMMREVSLWLFGVNLRRDD